VHRSPQSKWQIDWFSHFCTAHSKVSLGTPGYVLSPNNCPFPQGIWAPYNTCFLGPTRVHNPNGTSISSAVFAQLTSVSSGMSGHALLPQNCPFPWENCNVSSMWFLGFTRLSISIGSTIFAQMTAECPYTLQWAALSPSKLPLPMGASGSPSNT